MTFLFIIVLKSTMKTILKTFIATTSKQDHVDDSYTNQVESNHETDTYLLSEVCKFHKNYIITDADSTRYKIRSIRNIDTKEDCAINVHKIYPGAMGVQWNEYKECYARFGGKFSRRDEIYHHTSWACFFQPLYQGNS